MVGPCCRASVSRFKAAFGNEGCFFVFKAGGETSGHANHAGIATTDGYDFDFLRRQGVKAIDDLVNQLVGEDEGRFQRHKRVFGFLKTVADFFFVGIFEAEFVGAEMGENFGGFKLPKLVQLGFGLQGVSVNVVEIFEVGQELFGGGAFLPAQDRHPSGQKGEQVMDDIRALGFVTRTKPLGRSTIGPKARARAGPEKA
jgi:hypothetical protein